MNPTKNPRRKPGYQLEVMDGELLLYHPTETTILYCNPTASLVWHLCDGEHTAAEIVALLQDAYPDAADTLAADVDLVLDQFANHGAIDYI